LLRGVWNFDSQIVVTANSRNPGGINLLRADGSARFIKQTVDARVWSTLGAIAGGEVIDYAQNLARCTRVGRRVRPFIPFTVSVTSDRGPEVGIETDACSKRVKRARGDRETQPDKTCLPAACRPDGEWRRRPGSRRLR
jgi:hypothetical protein